jgi:hypothetical protein
MAINNSFSENVVSIEDEEIQQNEEEQTFEGNENPENVQRNLFDEFDEVASETEETEEYGSNDVSEDDASEDGASEDGASEEEDDSSDGIVDENLLYWDDINFSWDIDNVHDLIYGINLREDVTNLSITDKNIWFFWQDMSFYFELTDDGMISLDIDIWVHQKFLFSMETENSEKRLIPIEHRRNVHQNEDRTNAIGDLFPHINATQLMN